MGLMSDAEESLPRPVKRRRCDAPTKRFIVYNKDGTSCRYEYRHVEPYIARFLPWRDTLLEFCSDDYVLCRWPSAKLGPMRVLWLSDAIVTILAAKKPEISPYIQRRLLECVEELASTPAEKQAALIRSALD